MDEIETPQITQTQSIVRSGSEVLYRNEQIVEISPEEGVPHLLDYWRLILKRRWTVLSCLLIVFSTIAIGTLKQKPSYEGRVVLEINPQQPNVVNFREVVQFTPIEFDAYRETQYKVLQSRTLAEQVVEGLQLYKFPEFYRQRLLFGVIESDPEKIPSSSDPNPPDKDSDYFRNSVRNFQRAVDISPVRRSNLVEVSFLSRDRTLAARIANQLAQDYIRQNLNVVWKETEDASDWLQGKLVELKAKLEKSDEALQRYAQENSIVFLSEKQNSVISRLDQLQQEYTKAQAYRYEKESLYSLVQAGKVLDLPTVLQSQMIQNLTISLAEAERDYAQLTATVKPEYPPAIARKRRVDALQTELNRQKKALVQNIVDDYNAAVAREKYLQKAVEDQKKEVNEIAAKTIQYNILKRDVDTNKSLYEGLLQRMKEAQVSATTTASNIRVVDSAEVPKYPVRPRVLLNLVLGVILGLGLGIGLAFFQEYLDNTLKTPDDVEQFLRLPSLGVLPSFALNGAGKVETDQLVKVTPDSHPRPMAPAVQTDAAAMEAFRFLRTSILLSASPVPRTLLITSALPGEGKTTTTINLGATLASLGSKVVIVDCDMRRPTCHTFAGVENKPGFVKCLTGQVSLAEAIFNVPGVANLSNIPCGPIPPNPAEVLSSPLTGELLRKLRTQFDYVLVDSPPIMSVADSRILATLTDAVVLVARAHSTSYDVVRRARRALYSSGARILGVALNDVRTSRDGRGYNEFQYGYGYGVPPSNEASEESNPQGHTG